MKFFKIKNNSNFDLSDTEELIHSLGGYAQQQFGFKKPPVLNLMSDEGNALKPLGKTAFYDPQTMSVTIYTDGRHTKDILRSLAHELVHHTQNENGMLNDSGYHGEGYAQKNKDLRQSEKEAYLKGNMCFRDWEDNLKQEKPTIYNEWRTNIMSTKDWKNKELMENLTSKFGFKMDLGLLKEASCGSKDKMEEELNEEKDEKCPKCDSAPCKCEDIKEEKKKPDFADIDGDGDKEESMSKAQEDKKEKESDKDEDKKEEEKEEKSDKDLSKVPPQLRKHVAKSMKESRLMEFIKNEIRKQLKERK